MTRFPFVRHVALGLLVVAAAACRNSAPGGPPASRGTVPERGGEVVASLRSEPTTYNRYVDQTAAGSLLALLTHAALVRVDRATDTIEPALADRWTQSPDGLVYTLHLRDGVRFSDGTPFTSADVIFSFEALYDPRVKNSVLAADLTLDGKPLRVEAPDARTVVIRLPSVFAPGLRLVETLPILPRHKLQPALAEGRFGEAWAVGTPPSELAGLGPFVLAEHATGQRLRFTRNPHYWRADDRGVQLPYLDALTVLTTPDQNSEALRLQAGETDLMSNGDIRPDDYAAFKRASEQGKLRLIDGGLGLDPNLLWFNLSSAATADPRAGWLRTRAFREAVSCAVDREAIASGVYLGAAVPMYGFVSPGNRTWFSPATGCRHDLARARTLLASVGLTDRNGDGVLENATGQPARFSILTQRGHTIRERTVAMLQEQLRQVGLGVDVVALDPGGLARRWQAGDYDSIYFGVQTSATDPLLNRGFWLSSGAFHFWNPGQKAPATEWERRIDDLMQRQVTTLDLAERQRLFAEVQPILASELPALYLVAPKVTLAVSSRVVNERPAPQIPQLLWSADTLAVTRAR